MATSSPPVSVQRLPPRTKPRTPSSGGLLPTAERTLDRARMFSEELDRRPGIRKQPWPGRKTLASPRLRQDSEELLPRVETAVTRNEFYGPVRECDRARLG